uniref:Anion exchange protein n=1 Tax=Trichuris muris TaxID=70415 RepID=A0A5S6Q8R3_TRIMR
MNRIVRKISNTLGVSGPTRKDSVIEGRSDFLIDPLIFAQKVNIGLGENGPVHRLCSIIEDEEGESSEGTYHPLFCEMLKLFDIRSENRFSAVCWREVSRWIKYEETVETESNRWSKPHITLLTLQCLLQLRNSIRSGAEVMLDVNVDKFNVLAEKIVENWGKVANLSRAEMKVCKDIIMAPKYQLVGSKYGCGREGSLAINESFYNTNEPLHEESQPAYKTETKFPSIRPPQINLLRKVAKDTEGACVFIGRPDNISLPLSQFVRLKNATMMKNLFEIPIPLRFLFILLVPKEHVEKEAEAIARCIGTLFIDEVFSKVCYRAKDGAELCQGIDEFLSQCVVVPAGRLSLSSRLEPHENLLPAVPRAIGKPVDLVLSAVQDHEERLQRTGRIFGGLIEDVKTKADWYWSDYCDAFRGRFTQTIAAAIFLFFANVSKIITFGGVMDHVLQKQMNLLAGGICGVLYALFSGQPLCVLSATGPCLVFEVIMNEFCKKHGMDFLTLRLWVGLWTSAWLVLLVAIDASVFVAFITRFTEEAFATLISLIFLVKAVEELVEIGHNSPIITSMEQLYSSQCECMLNQNSSTSAHNFSNLLLPPSANFNMSREACLAVGGAIEGLQCDYKPDVFMFSFILFCGTFLIAKALKALRNSRFFTTKVRNTVADFNVTIAIMVMTATKWFVGVDVPCLEVPSKFSPTIDRSWFLNPATIEPWWITLVCILPATFFSLLILMDQNITSVIINRPENKLKKHFGYHLDLTVIAILIAICSFMGLPFYVAATVISLMHADSLRIVSETTAPGDKPQFLGLKEQRVTALIAHLLIGVSVLLTPFMKLVPMPVLLGVFLYMGITSLSEQQFFQRILIMFMPKKYQPDYLWLRQVQLRPVVEEYKPISMAFPLMLVFSVAVRKIILEKIFVARELQVLDDPLPHWRELLRSKRASHDKANLKLSGQEMTLLETAEKNR